MLPTVPSRAQIRQRMDRLELERRDLRQAVAGTSDDDGDSDEEE
jgi:hypothetical protein